MSLITLNGAKMCSIETTHSYIARKLNFPDYYGRNLDALWDLLSTISIDLRVVLINEDQLITSLGDYSSRLVDLFVEAAQMNENIHFEVKKANN